MKKVLKLAALMMAAMIPLAMFSGCSNNGSLSGAVVDQFAAPTEGEEIAVMVTSEGTIKFRLFPDVAPKAVQNFKTHAKNGYYNGMVFHRIIPDFMIQSGDPEGTGMGGESIWGAPFEDEFSDYVRNYRGALSMANSGADSNGSQFFVVQAGPETLADVDIAGFASQTDAKFPEEVVQKYKEVGGTPWLDNVHTVFGQAFEGLDVVDKIASYGSEGGTPSKEVTIESVTIEKYQP